MAEHKNRKFDISSNSRTIMVRNDEKDELLCREILLFEPYEFKERTRERENAWKGISESLNAIATNQFRVDSRAVRERFFHIKSRFKRKSKDDLKATGTSPEVTPLDQALQDICDRMKEASENLEKDNKDSKEKSNLEKLEAEEIRKQVVENLVKTGQRKRESQEYNTTPKSAKRHRSSGTDTLQYLREKGEREQELKVQELALRQQENSQQQNMINTMLQQMQVQNQQMMILAKLADKN